MSASKSVKPDDKEQSKAFIEKAREIGADEDKSAADELIGNLAKRQPEPRAPKKDGASLAGPIASIRRKTP
jgi:hypothetical protein